MRPLITPGVINVPSADQSSKAPDKRVDVQIDAAGKLYWNGEPVSRDEVVERFAAAGRQQPQPEIHLRADQAVPYRHVARTLADASRAGLTKVGFVRDPENP